MIVTFANKALASMSSNYLLTPFREEGGQSSVESVHDEHHNGVDDAGKHQIPLGFRVRLLYVVLRPERH